MNNLKELKPRKALNKAFLKVKPNRTEIEGFKANLITLLDRTNDTESEEFHKNLVSDFLKKTYYDPNHFINTKGRNDLVIHNGQNANSTVGVILEAKKPTNKAEMITRENINKKAFQELVLYYLRERITHKNLEVKHLVATNINEWFIFDATLFDRLFAQNKNLVKQFNDFEGGRLADTKTDFFYKQIAEPFIDSITSEIEFTYFNIQDYAPLLRGAGGVSETSNWGVSKHLPNPPQGGSDNSLIALFKLLSPEHLLKLPFTNDSNSLDKRFYSELLHIIGLTETKEGSKKLIERNKAGERHTGTILEDAIIQLDSLDKLSRLEKPNQFGNTQEERLFNVALELSITWINRILFLKLLEAQLITYHKTPLLRGAGGVSPLLRGAGGVSEYKFLNLDKIRNYGDLNSLFFQVLARKYDERNEDVKKIFEKVPYLNSSLFEPTDIEQVTLFISNLKDDKTIPIFSQTVLKDQQGKKRTGNLNTLQYLFEFLDAYDFGAEGGSAIQEDNKTLINASVLGLIFEKINGYKDGSFFTPGFITMYMCRETIRKAVVQKFNEAVKKSPLERGFRGVSPLLRGAGGVSSIREEGKSGVRRQIIPYDPKLKELARELRNNSTKSEIILWKELKGKFEDKYDFHRQKPLDIYIADFFCYELKLVIEIDGETHNWEETQQKDFQKETRLNELGLNVLRFPDSDIFKHLEATLETIRQYIQGYEKGDLSELKYEDSPLNPLTGNVGIVETHPQPLSRGTHPQPLSRGEFKSIDDVYEQIGEDRLFTREQANKIVNSIKICDPAVGSGHFLVSALNEMIAVKNDLKILQDRNGKRLKEYQVEVVNDELIVTDEEGELFEYTPPSPLERGERGVSERQRVQETLFHEKQTIIENCLFGVDINPNSVKICRLRLWIELLKNAYYKHLPDPPQGGNTPPLERGMGGVLETLPNIDINIKCGNSLVSRFAIDADLKQTLKKSKWTIDSYRIAVDTYRNAESKEQKREMERMIADIKSDFRSEISKNDPKLKRKAQLAGELYNLTMQQSIFEESPKEKKERLAKVAKLEETLNKLEAEIEEIKANKIFENAFEWRFEFPEVLNDDGDFVGFDVVIGNPPYGVNFNKENGKVYENLYETFNWRGESYTLFIEKAIRVLNKSGYFSFIIPDTIINLGFTESIRKYILKNTKVSELTLLPSNVFADATVDTILLFFQKANSNNEYNIADVLVNTFDKKVFIQDLKSPVRSFTINTETWFLTNNFNLQSNSDEINIISKIDKKYTAVETFTEMFYGIKVYQVGKGKPAQTSEIRDNKPFTSKERKTNEWLPFFDGKDIGYYSLLWKQNNWLNYGPWLAEPRVPEKFEGEKILIRKITGKTLIANYIPYTSYCNTLLFVLKLKKDKAKISYKALLGVLNSKFIGWYFRKKFQITDEDTFPQIMIRDIQQFAVPNENNTETKKIESLVDQILTKKSKDSSADTTDLENQIVQLVYQLYELTEEEIKIVEGV